MIHYALRCDRNHAFDGWFRDCAAFEAQGRDRLLECPHCGSTSVDRALMAPSLAKADRAAAIMPAAMKSMLQKLRREVEQRCDNVGESFAPTALAMHRGEIETRAIYGQADADQAAELKDEGVEIMLLPWVPLADS